MNNYTPIETGAPDPQSKQKKSSLNELKQEIILLRLCSNYANENLKSNQDQSNLFIWGEIKYIKSCGTANKITSCSPKGNRRLQAQKSSELEEQHSSETHSWLLGWIIIYGNTIQRTLPIWHHTNPQGETRHLSVPTSPALYLVVTVLQFLTSSLPTWFCGSHHGKSST